MSKSENRQFADDVIEQRKESKYQTFRERKLRELGVWDQAKKPTEGQDDA